MKVRELVETLQRLPDQDATVVIGEGMVPDVWLIVEGASVAFASGKIVSIGLVRVASRASK